MIFRSNIARLLVVVCSVSLFGAALCFPALLFDDHPPESGAQVLMWGWWGLLTADFAWFANPAFFLGVLAFLTRRLVAARLLAAGAIALGATSFYAKAWWFDEGQGTPITGLGNGFTLWMLSFSVLLVGSLIIIAPNHAKPPVADAPGSLVT